MKSGICLWWCNSGLNLDNETLQLDCFSKISKIVVQQNSKGYYLKIQSTTVWCVITKQFTAKYSYGKKSYGEVSLRQSVFSANCLHGEGSPQRNVPTATCPYDGMSLGRNVLRRNDLRRKVLRQKVLRRKVRSRILWQCRQVLCVCITLGSFRKAYAEN